MRAEKFTDERFFSHSPVVKSQAFPMHEARAATEPPKPVKPLTWRHIEALEATIESGQPFTIEFWQASSGSWSTRPIDARTDRGQGNFA